MDIERVVVELSETEHRVLDPADAYFLAGAGGQSRFLVSNALATRSELLAALLHRHAGSVSGWLETL